MNEILPNQSQTETPDQAQPSYKVHNWIALVYVILLAITFFNQNEDLASILFFVMGGFGLVAGGSFIGRMFKLRRSVQNSLTRAFILLEGIGGGIVIFIIAGIVALIGAFRHASWAF